VESDAPAASRLSQGGPMVGPLRQEVHVKVLVATHRTQGTDPDDYAWALDGELVHLPALECGISDGCGCERGFAGVTSRHATTTAEVATRALDRDDIVAAVADSLLEGGWFPDEVDAVVRREAELLAHQVTADLLELALRLPVGTVLGRRGTKLTIRALPPVPDGRSH
jgi:hypothetical protein